MIRIINQDEKLNIKLLCSSQTTKGAYYYIELNQYGWACSCPQNTYKYIECKHIIEAKKTIKLNEGKI